MSGFRSYNKLMARKAIPVDVTIRVLHECAYKCANPRCRYPITLDRHHLIEHSKGGSDMADNLLALCPNCHAEHHAGKIPIETLRAWKMLLVTINEAFSRQTVDLLLAVHRTGRLALSGGDCAPLIASGLIDFEVVANGPLVTYFVSLNQRGKLFIDGWMSGNQSAAIPDSFQSSS
jgi:HNH endonuclease